ncbi:MAG TPA: GTPase Era [Acidimicrobiia bacterium]|nr:GTPase Era [Acidimicrobiia bacterium]
MAFRSGFATLVGRPNVGKSSLVNRLVGTNVAITSSRPQTTRAAVRAIRHTADTQLVLVDTPGLHRPRTLLGERTNARAEAALADVDVVGLVIAADESVGPGDRHVAALVGDVATPCVLVVNKTDTVERERVDAQRARAEAQLGSFAATVTCSARTGDGIDALAAALEAQLPAGPRYYPEDMVTDEPDTVLAAELVREQLLRVARDELPHSIAVTVEELDPDPDHPPSAVLRLLVDIHVERPSQRPIVLGRGGATLKAAVTAARLELEVRLGRPVFLQTRVRVERNWQRRPRALDRLGL